MTKPHGITPRILKVAERLARGGATPENVELAQKLEGREALAKWATSIVPELWIAFDCDDGTIIGGLGLTRADVAAHAQRHRSATGKYCWLQSCVPGGELSGHLRYPPTARLPDGTML